MGQGLVSRLKRAWRAFEGAQSTPQHHRRPFNAAQSPDGAIEAASTSLTEWAIHLDENHDLAIGILDHLVTGIVGTGVQVAPDTGLPRLDDEISTAWDTWGRAPEVTGTLPFGELQRLVCRAWLRDGEIFAQHVQNRDPYPWGGGVRYRLELLESAMVPMDYFETNEPRWRHGVLLDSWNRPLEYRVYLRHPHDYTALTFTNTGALLETKSVPADKIVHLKFARRHPQTRGVTIFHGIIRRLNSVKRYESAENTAAEVAASMCAFIRRHPDATTDDIGENSISGERQRKMQSGQIFDDLLPGEDIGVIDVGRPNPELNAYRNSQLRALAAGTGAQYSSIARDYAGTYASQRQELVDTRPNFLRLRNLYVDQFLRTIYERWLNQAWLQGAINVPSGMPWTQLRTAEYMGPGMGWVDPRNDVDAKIAAIDAGLMTREQVIREEGRDPRTVPAPAPRQPQMTMVSDGQTQDQSDAGTASDAE